MAPSAPSTASVFAFAGLYVLVVAIFVWAALTRRRSHRWIAGPFVVFALAALAATLLTGERHDYFHWVGQWSNTMSGGDPWDQTLEEVDENSGYGPLFNVFAPLASLNPLLPKALFALAWLGTAIAFTRLFTADERLRPMMPLVLAYFALNPYYWVEIALYGHFDILPAAATVASVHLVLRSRELEAGAALAVGALLKLTPVVALPFVVAACPRRWKETVLGFASVVLVVEAVSYGIWGTSALTFPFLAADQESKLLSIFQFLRGDYSPLQLLTDEPNLDRLSVPLLVIAGALLVWSLAFRRAHPVVAVLATFVVVLGLYMRGHQQFQMLVFVLAPYLFLTVERAARLSRLLWLTLGVYLAWFSAFSVVYVLGGQLRTEPWVELREIVGLPTFLLTIATVVVLLQFRATPLRVPARARSLKIGRKPDLGRRSRSAGALPRTSASVPARRRTTPTEGRE